MTVESARHVVREAKSSYDGRDSSLRKAKAKTCTLPKAQALCERIDDALTDRRTREAGRSLELEREIACSRLLKREWQKREVKKHRKANAELEQIRAEAEAVDRRTEDEVLHKIAHAATTHYWPLMWPTAKD
ncbi:hypothetical protein FOL47_001998 [Perkinsus chesapeaki]|uniref:Uncharacterized protein n=1 Tax=Perkinsus chesapeaki TaxID=330153 RepID=A0A7J6MHR2_PERCH|nr:hypothetical protein FOL47_001998 [Perkinsus chesapeaki]